MYDNFSADYDRFVNWNERLAFEMPFIEKQIQKVKSRKNQPLDILDTACGTGMHAVALAKLGHKVSAADLFPEMIYKSHHNAHEAGVELQLVKAGLGDMARTFGRENFDLVLCLGNSLPHLLTLAELADSVRDFAACLRPGGMVLIQNRNFDAVMSSKMRWMDPQPYHEGEAEWLFQRFYDFEPDGLIRFNIVTLKRYGSSSWQAAVTDTRLRPQLRAEIEQTALRAGFIDLQFSGSMKGEPFAPVSSGNLILTAYK